MGENRKLWFDSAHHDGRNGVLNRLVLKPAAALSFMEKQKLPLVMVSGVEPSASNRKLTPQYLQFYYAPLSLSSEPFHPIAFVFR